MWWMGFTHFFDTAFFPPAEKIEFRFTDRRFQVRSLAMNACEPPRKSQRFTNAPGHETIGTSRHRATTRLPRARVSPGSTTRASNAAPIGIRVAMSYASHHAANGDGKVRPNPPRAPVEPSANRRSPRKTRNLVSIATAPAR